MGYKGPTKQIQVRLVAYSRLNKLQDKPEFSLWVPYTLKKRIAIISKIKSKLWKKTHKYGIKIPRNVKEAKVIDIENGNKLWEESMVMEMINNRCDFKHYGCNTSELVAYKEITGHLIFYVKLSENFRRKARFVADGHLVETPSSITYILVVSRDSVRILLLAAALNDLDIMGADAQNTFLSAYNLEKHWIRAVPKFGPEQGKVFIVVRALYGLKSSSAAFGFFISKKLDEIGFKYRPADPDMWIRPAIKPDGEEYYEYVLMYVDDILVIPIDPTETLKSMEGKTVKYNNGKIAPPEMYLVSRLNRKMINGNMCWTITSYEYVIDSVRKIKDAITQKPWKTPKTADTPTTK